MVRFMPGTRVQVGDDPRGFVVRADTPNGVWVTDPSANGGGDFTMWLVDRDRVQPTDATQFAPGYEMVRAAMRGARFTPSPARTPRHPDEAAPPDPPG